MNIEKTYKNIFNLIKLFSNGRIIDLFELDKDLNNLFNCINSGESLPKNFNNDVIDLALDILAQKHPPYSEFKNNSYGLKYNERIYEK